MEFDTRSCRSDADFGYHQEVRNSLENISDEPQIASQHLGNVQPTSNQLPNELQRPLRIMVVEDTPASQKLFAKILEPAGYQLYIAANGIEAIRDFSRIHPDLIIMDLQMPILDGFQTTSILRALDTHHPNTPIIATSARQQPLDREHFYAVGVDAFISKPFDNEEFLSLIKQVFDHKHQHAEGEPFLDCVPKVTVFTMQTPTSSSVIDIAKALNRLGGDKQLMGDLINFFFEDFPSLLDDLRGAILRHDWNRLQRAAHSFKGLAANFDAAPAVQVLQQMELQCADHNPEQMSRLLATAEFEVARLTAALAEYQNSPEAA